jgi:hypothetical protein
MEDILDVYQRPFDPFKPVVCLDETCKEIHGNTREPLPATPASEEGPAQPQRQDYEYERHGTASIFMIYEPLTGNCLAEVLDRRTSLDYARMIRHLCDEMYPEAEKIVLVQDNLNTHSIASLYKAFEPEQARRLARRLEIHYTPAHGSWLNMAEIAIGVLSRQCLGEQRFPDHETLAGQVNAWNRFNRRNPMKADWRFTAQDARIKLKRLYPKITRPQTDQFLVG